MGRTTQSSGGTFNLGKCSWVFHNMIQWENGEREYRDTDKKREKGGDESDWQEELDELDSIEMSVSQLLGDSKMTQLPKSKIQ